MKKITLSGSSEEIGFLHGKLLAKEIHSNIKFYKAIFLQSFGEEARILDAAENIKERIKEFNPRFINEIDRIALGAEVSEPLWLYALNSRTELGMAINAGECTAIVFPQHSVLGQTWDWAQHLEGTSVMMEIQFPSGHKLLQLTEAGIIGKIGFNNCGLGVTLNIIRIADAVLQGVPIHIVLRSVLESRTLDDALSAVERARKGTASNIVIAQGGRAIDVEFAGGENIVYKIPDAVYVHTNHYLHTPEPVQIDETACINSTARYHTAVEKLGKMEGFSSQEMISLFSHQSGAEHSILCPFKPHTQAEMGMVGTLATIVMDLDRRSIFVREGNPSSSSFLVDQFIEYNFENGSSPYD